MSSSPREATRPVALRTIGRVAKPHGVRGEFAVFLEIDDPDWLTGQERFYAQTPEGQAVWRVKSARFHGPRLLLKVDAVDSRERAEAFRGTPILLPEAEIRDHQGGSGFFFNSDLVGLAVVDAMSGETHGRVRDVIDMPAQNLLEVEREDGATFLVPFTKPIVGEIDAERIAVNLPAGLVECNLDEKPRRQPRQGGKSGRRR